MLLSCDNCRPARLVAAHYASAGPSVAPIGGVGCRFSLVLHAGICGITNSRRLPAGIGFGLQRWGNDWSRQPHGCANCVGHSLRNGRKVNMPHVANRPVESIRAPAARVIGLGRVYARLPSSMRYHRANASRSMPNPSRVRQRLDSSRLVCRGPTGIAAVSTMWCFIPFASGSGAPLRSINFLKVTPNHPTAMPCLSAKPQGNV